MPDFDWHFLIFRKCRISKSGFTNAKLATLHVTSDCKGPLLLGRRNCCVTRPGIGPPWLNKKICTVRFLVCLQF